MSKFLCTDIGNVLCRLNINPFLSKLSSTFNISMDEASDFLKNNQSFHDLGYSTIESDLRNKFGVKSDLVIKDILCAWNDILEPDYNMLDMLIDLQVEYGLKIALLSNMGPEHKSIMNNDKLSYRWFYDKCITHLSCDVGSRKPFMLYYQSFLLEHPEFKGCLYLDDIKENLNTGTQLGFNSYHFDLNNFDMYQKLNEIKNIRRLIVSNDI